MFVASQRNVSTLCLYMDTVVVKMFDCSGTESLQIGLVV